jgi:hypothetical protein
MEGAFCRLLMTTSQVVQILPSNVVQPKRIEEIEGEYEYRALHGDRCETGLG